MIGSFQGKATQHGGKPTARRVLSAHVNTIKALKIKMTPARKTNFSGRTA
jgi:hypothetical protein